MKLLELGGAKFDIVLKEKMCHVSWSWCVCWVSLLSTLITKKNMEAKISRLLIEEKLIKYIKWWNLAQTLSKHPPKGKKSFYEFLLIISNVGSTYFENLKCQISFFFFLFSKMKISWGFFQKNPLCKS